MAIMLLVAALSCADVDWDKLSMINAQARQEIFDDFIVWLSDAEEHGNKSTGNLASPLQGIQAALRCRISNCRCRTHELFPAPAEAEPFERRSREIQR